MIRDVMTQSPRTSARSPITIGIDDALRPQLAELAAGRALVVDFFASRRCSVTIGDLTADFRRDPPGPAFAALAPLEGVLIYVERRLLPVLAAAVATVRLAGPPFARHLALSLDPAECWIDFLDGPSVLSGKRHPLNDGSAFIDSGA